MMQKQLRNRDAEHSSSTATLARQLALAQAQNDIMAEQLRRFRGENLLGAVAASANKENGPRFEI